MLSTLSLDYLFLLSKIKIWIFKRFMYILYMNVLSLSPDTPEEGIWSHYRWLWASPCGCWELNSGPLEEQSVLLTIEPSLQPLSLIHLLTMYTEFCLHAYTVKSHYIDGCEPPCGCQELNSGLLEEQSALLTTEPSLQPRFLYSFFFLRFIYYYT